MKDSMCCSPSGDETCGWCKGPMGPGHNKLCCMILVSEALLVIGLVALVAAWITAAKSITWMGLSSDHLFHDALAFLILSLMGRMKADHLKGELMMSWMDDCEECGCDEGGCGSGGCGNGGCGGESEKDECCGGCGEGQCCGGGDACNGSCSPKEGGK